jgi:hypothetical protein
MRILLKMLQFVGVVLLLVSCPALSAQYAEAQNTKAQNEIRPIRNIVLVHGAWADGSGWKSVYDILVKEGFNVSIVQEPETSFKEDVAADLSDEQAAFMARSQVFNFADNFKRVITAAAWRSKPSWMLVAGSDRTINPDLERWYAERAKSHKVEVPGASHVVYISHPKEVAALIEESATHAE